MSLIWSSPQMMDQLWNTLRDNTTRQVMTKRVESVMASIRRRIANKSWLGIRCLSIPSLNGSKRFNRCLWSISSDKSLWLSERKTKLWVVHTYHHQTDPTIISWSLRKSIVLIQLLRKSFQTFGQYLSLLLQISERTEAKMVITSDGWPVMTNPNRLLPSLPSPKRRI